MPAERECLIYLSLGIHLKKPEGPDPKRTAVKSRLISMPLTQTQIFSEVRPLTARVGFARIRLGAAVFQASAGALLAFCARIERAPRCACDEVCAHSKAEVRCVVLQ